MWIWWMMEHQSSRKKILNNLAMNYGHRVEWIQQYGDC